MLVNGVVGAAPAGPLQYGGREPALSDVRGGVARLGAGGASSARCSPETKEVRPGVTGAEMGIDSPIGLVVAFLVLFGLVMVGQLCFPPPSRPTAPSSSGSGPIQGASS